MSAELYNASRRRWGVTGISWSKVPDRSTAAAPAACGDAIEVPLNMAYPMGSVYPASARSGCLSHCGTVEMAEPGAEISGLKSPDSVGPREENGCRACAAETTEP